LFHAVRKTFVKVSLRYKRTGQDGTEADGIYRINTLFGWSFFALQLTVKK
jgi:hypothetical protein